MDTSAIMGTALRMAGFESIPADSGIWVPGEGIKKVLFSIDAGAAEIMFAKSSGYDLLIAHHPVGPARLKFSKVVRRHMGFMLEKGVPKSVAKKATDELVSRIEVSAHPGNYMQDVEIARKLKMPFMNVHLPIDQITRDYLLGAISPSKAKSVGSLVAALGEIKEFRRAKTKIEVGMGARRNPLGKWVLVFAAGTNGGYPVARAYFEHGVDTVVYLHVDHDALLKLRHDCTGNLIVLGHMAGDSIGINLFTDELSRHGLNVDTIGAVR